MAHAPKGERASALDQKRAFQKLVQEWGWFLNPAEFKLAAWLMAATHGWGNEDGVFSQPQILNGIPDTKEGGWHTRGINMTARGLRGVVGRLHKIGLIQVQWGGRATRYRINMQWNPEVSMGLAIPKRLQPGAQQGEERRSGLGRNAVPVPPEARSSKGGTPFRPYCSNSNEAINECSNPTCGDTPPREQGAKEILSKTIQQAGEKTRASRAAKAAKGDLRAVWVAAWSETFPQGVTAPLEWTKKEQAMLRHAAKRWPEHAHGPFANFIDWAVRNWTRMLTVKFSWMTKQRPPVMPNAGFLIAFMDRFADCYADRALHEFLAGQPDEQRFYWSERRRGKTHDEALLELATRAALAADREKRQNDIKEAARLYRMADLMRKQAESHPRWTKDNPHPQATPGRATGSDRDYLAEGVEFKPIPIMPWPEEEQ
jgi:hypothetical protein